MAFCLNQIITSAYGEKMNNSRLLISLFFACCLILSSLVSVFADSKIIKSSSIAMNGEPKYPFVGRIVEAYYTNPDLTEIDIIHNYDIPDDGVHKNGGKEGTTVFSVSVDETDERFLALLQEFSYESLDECTRNRNEAFREQFREAFRDYAQRNQAEIFEEVKIEDVPLDLIFDYDSENEMHKDFMMLQYA